MKKFYLLFFSLLSITFCMAQQDLNRDIDNLLKRKPHLKDNLYKKSQLSDKKITRISGFEENTNNIALIGGNGESSGQYVLTDDTGKTFVIGQYFGQMELEGQILTGTWPRSHFLATYDTNFELLSFKNIFETDDYADVHIDFSAYDENGILIVGRTNSDLTIGDETLSISENKAFVLKLNADGSLNWFKDYDYFVHMNQRYKEVPVDFNDTHIFAGFKENEITQLNKSGDIISTIQLPSFSGQINDIALQTDAIVIAGYFENEVQIGDVTLFETNQYQASFIASLDLTTFETNWAHENSVETPDQGDSFGEKLLTDSNNNIYLQGPARNSMKWGTEVLTGYFSGGFVTKFQQDGTIDTTLFYYSSINEIEMINDKIFISTKGTEEINFTTDVGSADLIVLDNNLAFLETIELPVERNNYLRLNALSESGGDLYVTGVLDYNYAQYKVDAANYTIKGEKYSDSKNSGYFDIYGLEINNGNTYIGGNKNGSIEVYDTVVSDNSTLIIAEINKNNGVNWLTSLYNARFTWFGYGNKLMVNKNSNKITIIASASDGFSIGDDDYDITGNFVAQFNEDGTLSWIKSIPINELQSLVYDKNNNIYISGSMTEDFTYGSETYVQKGNKDYFIMKFTASGDFDWFKNFGTSFISSYSSGISSDNNNVYFSGEYDTNSSGETTVTIGDYDVTIGSEATGNNIAFAIAEDGTVNWARSHGAGDSYQYSWSTSLTGNTNGGFYMLGVFGKSNNFDQVNLEGSSIYSHYIARYDQDGKVIWVNPILFIDNGIGLRFNYNEIRTDEQNNVYIQGGINDSAFFENDTLVVQEGKYSNYVAKYMEDGSLDWVNSYSADYISSKTMAVSAEDVVKIGGNIEGYYETGTHSGNAFYGHSYIMDFCNNPAIPDKPTGLAEVFQGNTTSYISNIEDYNTPEWLLSPAEAGEIVYGESDSVAIKWAADYTGAASLKVNQSNACEQSDFSPSLTINISSDGVAATNTSQLHKHLTYYPNPVSSQLHLEWNEHINVLSIELFDMMGRKILQKDISNQSTVNSINMNSLKQGTYLLKIDTSDGEIIERIVKKVD